MNSTRVVMGLIAWTGLCLGAGLIGSVFTTRSVGDWYLALSKPSWTPPQGVFGPVWTVLYVMMGVAAWLVWRRSGLVAAALPLALFAVQLVLNIAWSAIFFGMRQPGWAFVDIVALWVAVFVTMIAFYRVTPTAGVLLAPYLVWITFASALNLSIWRMNS